MVKQGWRWVSQKRKARTGQRRGESPRRHTKSALRRISRATRATSAWPLRRTVSICSAVVRRPTAPTRSDGTAFLIAAAKGTAQERDALISHGVAVREEQGRPTLVARADGDLLRDRRAAARGVDQVDAGFLREPSGASERSATRS